MSRLHDNPLFLQRDWLSANHIVFLEPDASATVVDTGYCAHAAYTQALITQTLAAHAAQGLGRILNTHLHSDHCGGNAALQAAWPQVRTFIPPGQMQAVRDWDSAALSYQPTGQECPPFRVEGVLQPGTPIALGHRLWQVYAAPGHDPHAVMLFEPQQGWLISGDALWENGFGVVFPELEGVEAFAQVQATLDLIAHLAPRRVLPGHGRVFEAVPQALADARRRLEGFVRDPQKHARYAAKVLIKYKLLEWGHIEYEALQAWACATPYHEAVRQRYFADRTSEQWLAELVDDLQRSGAARREGSMLINV